MSFEQLAVWNEAHQLVLATYRSARDFPADERFRLVDQLTRAAASVPTNIAEGTGRGSKREFIQFLLIARGSLEETKYLLLLSKDLGYLGEDRYQTVRDHCDRVGRQLNALIRSLRNGS